MISHQSQTDSEVKPLADEMVEAAEICRALKVSYPTFIRMTRRGELPVRRIGGRWKISRRMLREYMDGKSATSDAAIKSEQSE